ncbi:DNase I-like protein [Tilletiaria anomala UBC 951]|uniref:DNase I-like protein n=1 Tax=Tilletiaria anomala (strain ATCC 24038 / CBS 436.72 / UBC 951) TaxID=1037660 RepID=A0A066WDK6_TILAU|nr:DNase I-like protein [Tilletiaria anomala UBC 951]KDN52022.1 DNase I-like protein [Tilletiaria anomala UBC 951]
MTMTSASPVHEVEQETDDLDVEPKRRLFIGKRTSSKPQGSPQTRQKRTSQVGNVDSAPQTPSSTPQPASVKVFKGRPGIEAVPVTDLTIVIPTPRTIASIQEEGAAPATITPQSLQHRHRTPGHSCRDATITTTDSSPCLYRVPSARHRLRKLLHRHAKSAATNEFLSHPASAELLESEPVAHRMLGAAAVAPSFGGDESDGDTGSVTVQGPTLLTTVPVSELIDDLTPQAEWAESKSGSNSKFASLPPVPVLVQSTTDVKSMAVALQTDEIPAVQQKPNIKVRIITWNMHESVPRGNLESLLGKVGPYIAPEPGWDRAASSDTESEKDDAAAGVEESAERRAGRQRVRAERRRKRGKVVVGQEETVRQDRIPPLPYDDKHPYHVLIVAGQECPWGDGNRLATGVGLAGELGDLSRSKSKAVHKKDKEKGKDRERENKDKEGTTEGGEPISATLSATSTTADAQKARDSDPLTPSVTASDFATGKSGPDLCAYPSITGNDSTSGAGGDYLALRANAGPAPTLKGWGGKGWSDVCEEWYCKAPGSAVTASGVGASASRNEMLGTHTGAVSTPIPISRSSSHVGTPLTESGDALSPEGAASFPRGKGKDGLLANGVAKLAVPTPPFPKRNKSNISPTEGAMVTAQAAVEHQPASASAKPKGEHPETINQSAFAEPRASLSSSVSAPSVDLSKKNFKQNLRIDIAEHVRSIQPQTAEDGTPLVLGTYELVIKERMMGCYLACYVWRGCLDRVRGVSRGHVKSGLLSGRVGNKGGCGISLKLGQTRLLFVNAHLAAHEGRVATRIANVEKIKAELELDTFLPAHDPRNALSDITEKFDHTFWFGDLNFRVDITRKHADWLIMQKRYDDALEFDQLRKIMREGDVFKGFEEAPIAFPPTFKFDVIKTVKLKRAKTGLRAIGQSAGSNQGKSVDDLSFVARDASKGSMEMTRARGESVTGQFDTDAASLSSISGSQPSNTCMEDFADQHPLPMDDDDLYTRDDIISADVHARTVERENEKKARSGFKGLLKKIAKRGDQPVGTPKALAFSEPVQRSASASTSSSSVDMPASTPAPASLQQAREFALAEDASQNGTEGEQPYDTSSKQRVPSWCDRVLWRSNVEAIDEATTLEGIGRRMSAAFANAIHSAKSRKGVTLHYGSDQLVERSMNAHEARAPSTAGPAITSALNFASEHWSFGDASDADKAGKCALSRMRLLAPRRSNSADHTSHVSKGMRLDTKAAASAVDLHSPASHQPDKSPERTASLSFRITPFDAPRRSWSQGRIRSSGSVPCVSAQDAAANASASTEDGAGDDRGIVATRRRTGRSMSLSQLSAHAEEGAPERRGTWWQEHISPFLPSFLQDGGSSDVTVPASANGAISALSRKLSFALPWMSGDSSMTNMAGTAAGGDDGLPHLVGPDKGHVDCLLYRSLDDKEMRQLEGRSDHRPVVFVACIGI